MNRSFWNLLYPALGLIAVLIMMCADGRRGIVSAILAWVICGVPIVAVQVAKWFGVRKTSLNRELIAFPPGLMVRLTWTLGASSALYYLYGQQLGIGFWIAVLAFYQAALATRTRHLLDGDRT